MTDAPVPLRDLGTFVPRRGRRGVVLSGSTPDVVVGVRMDTELSTALADFLLDMQTAKLSEATVKSRVKLLRRLHAYLDGDLLAATPDKLREFQRTYSHLAPATVDVYTRHVRAYYQWAFDNELIPADPSTRLVLPKLHRGRPHPVSPADLRVILAATRGPLRLAYVLAAFAGLRRGEICRLRGSDLDLSIPPTALIHGKGGHERVVPLLAPVIAELGVSPRRGYVVLNKHGKPYSPDALSSESHRHLYGLGYETTLHSMRHFFATQAAKLTRDPLFVRDLLGHSSVATTEIYMDTSLSDAHARLDELAKSGDDMLNPRRLRSV